MTLIEPISRREFIKHCSLLGLMLGVSPFSFLSRAEAKTGERGYITPREASFYKKMGDGSVQCTLCPRMCIIHPGRIGFCRTRENIDGTLFTLAYANPCALHVDPIEKEPLYHFLPATHTLSIATSGCSFRCKACQNWQISQRSPKETINFHLAPDRIIRASQHNRCRSICYTYTEPIVFIEYMIAIGRAAKEQGIRNLCHTNGFINKRPLMELIQTLDAVNVDLKGFSDDYYRTMCQGWLKPITECLLFLKAKGVHLEISNLVIPTKNDNTDTTRRMCKWIKENLGAETPLHFIRFYPHYKLTHLPPTPVSILEAMRNTALSEGLKFSYIVNLPGHPGAHTYCPRCSRLLIRRSGFVVEELHIKENGRCKFCNESISGVWS